MAKPKYKINDNIEYSYSLSAPGKTIKSESISNGIITWIGANGRHFTIVDESRPVKDYKGIEHFEHNVGIENIKKIIR